MVSFYGNIKQLHTPAVKLVFGSKLAKFEFSLNLWSQVEFDRAGSFHLKQPAEKRINKIEKFAGNNLNNWQPWRASI